MSKKDRIVMLLALLTIVVLPTQAQEQKLTDESLFIPYIADIQFAPVYVAIEKGYFKDAGFNVTPEYNFQEPTGVELIAAGQRDFGIISAEQVILARAKARPVVYVYGWFQQYPVGVAAPDDSGIKTVADLKGHKVGIPGRYGASYTGLTAMLSANKMTENDIQLQEIGFNAPEVVCVGGVDASVVYINNEPLQIEQKCGKKVTVFPVADYAALVSNGIVTSEKVIADHPDEVKAFVAAFDHGLRDAIDNPAEAYLISTKYVENLPLTDNFKAALDKAAADQQTFLATTPDREAVAKSRDDRFNNLTKQFDGATLLQFHVLLNSIALWDADKLGQTGAKSWQLMQDTLMSIKDASGAPVLANPVDLDKAYTNQFVPGG
jgi:NitT/TauT family transport system substrate-binding protein